MSMMTGAQNIFSRSYRIPRIDWSNRLDWTAAELGKLASGTEGEFLSIGERLQNFYLQARDLTEVSGRLRSVVDHIDKREHLEDLTAKYTMERERNP